MLMGLAQANGLTPLKNIQKYTAILPVYGTEGGEIPYLCCLSIIQHHRNKDAAQHNETEEATGETKNE